LICRREHIADVAARLDTAKSTTRSSAAVGGKPRYSDIREKESVIRTDTDQINQPRIARGNQRLKSAPIARKARVSTAINSA